ncbi:MAG: hypothetical protein ABIR66_08090 [Saprospiraceae bacterium]
MTRIFVFFVLSVLLFSNCKTKYQRTLDRELASGIHHDSLFLGLALGMEGKKFYAICWDLNKAGKMTQGPNNLSARFTLTDDLKAPANMDFYPTFKNDTIVEMPALFTYRDWAPWNKSLVADSLLVDIRHLAEKWYGPGLFEIKNKSKGNLWIKVDGNRRIKISKEEPNAVRMIITDMANPPIPIL